MGNKLLLYLIVLSEIVSVYFLYKLWRGGDFWVLKFLMSFLILTPFLGPVVYLLISDSSPRERNQLNASGNLFGRGRYIEWWDNEKSKLEKKIKQLKREGEIDKKEAKGNEKKDD